MASNPNLAIGAIGDVDKSRKFLKEMSPLDVEIEEARRDQERAMQAAMRRAKTQTITHALESDKEEWRDLVQRLDQELEKVDAQAERDAQLRAWATFFQIVSLSASLIQEITESEVPCRYAP